jgi:putative tricarboxylic transport membrane protein
VGSGGAALIASGVRRTAVEPAARAGMRPWVLLALAAGYAAAMPWLGFISSSALFVVLALRALGYRHGWRAAALGLSAAFVVYGIFGVVMNVPLPEGLLG